MDVIISGWYRLSTFARDLVDNLHSPQCALCDARRSDAERICRACRLDLPRHLHPCPRCAEPLDAESAPRRSLCPRCEASLPPHDHCVAAFAYEFPLPALIGDFKYRRQVWWARALAQAARPAFDARFGALQGRLLPMPMHPRREAERGYNQAERIALELGRLTGWSVDARLCHRVRHADAQAGLSAAARRRNLQGAFAVASPLPSGPMVIVDDVMTTGSSVTALAEALRAAGHQDLLGVFCLARAARRPSDGRHEVINTIDDDHPPTAVRA